MAGDLSSHSMLSISTSPPFQSSLELLSEKFVDVDVATLVGVLVSELSVEACGLVLLSVIKILVDDCAKRRQNMPDKVHHVLELRAFVDRL